MRYSHLFLLLFFCNTLVAQSLQNRLSTTDGGSAYEVCWHNNYLYVGAANTLKVFSLNGANQTPDSLVFKRRLLSNVDQILVHNGYLYVCANHDGLYKFDLTNPEQPLELAHYIPENLEVSVYDVAFFGDTIAVAAKTQLNLIKDNGTSFSYLATIANYPNPTRIRGLDSKGNLLAYTVAYNASSTNDGVYLYDMNSMTQLAFYHEMASDPLEVYFGQNTDLLHVMGGVLTTNLFHGLYYALDYSTLSNLNNVYQDTIMGTVLLGSVAAPMSAKLINDTIYIATQGGGPINFNPVFTGQVYVYDGTNASTISLLTDLYAGLYHFDVDINEATRKMYVASEWYGILTVDVADIYNEVDLGLTYTGGWCHGSAYANNRLVEANEGYGVRLFDLTNKQAPVLLAENLDVGFCRAVSISDAGDYVYGWYLTNQGLRIYDGNNLTPISDLTVQPLGKIDFKKSRHHNGTLAVILEATLASDRIVIADVSNPAAPSISHYRNKANLEDLLFHANGTLFACARDSIVLFDPVTMNVLDAVTPPLGGFQPFKAFTMNQDTLYVYYGGVGEGIARYYYNGTTQNLTYLDATVYNMQVANGDRVFMTSNDSTIFIASTIDSLKAISIQMPHQELDGYNHGADFIYDNLWGVHDLYIQDGYLFLNEYMGQTTIFGPSPMTNNISIHKEMAIRLYPNPTSQQLYLEKEVDEMLFLEIYNLKGQLLYRSDWKRQELRLDVSEWPVGGYVLKAIGEHKQNVQQFSIIK